MLTRLTRSGGYGRRTDMTRRRVDALLQSLESSRHRIVYSGLLILARTIASTCCDASASPHLSPLRPVGTAEISPARRKPPRITNASHM
jgi:hypothetical protein